MDDARILPENEESNATRNATRQELYQRYRDELLQRQRSNSRSVFTASCLMLFGISYIFVYSTENLWFLVVAQILLILAMLTTLASFKLSQLINQRLLDAERYYLHGESEYLNRISLAAHINELLTRASAILFAIAMMLLVSAVF